MLSSLKSSLASQFENTESVITADLQSNWNPTSRQTTRTIPGDILVTEQRPDVTIINRPNKTITLVELSICWDQDHPQARLRKQNRYEELLSELDERGWEASLATLEIGSRGFSGNETAHSLKRILPNKRLRTTLLTKLNHISINCSHKIFQEHNNTLWNPTTLLV